MAVYQLENEHVYLEVSDQGAELIRLNGKKTGRAYLFDADPRYWKRHSPVLFPLVGSLREKQYRYGGKSYSMSQHGFARDRQFQPERRSADSLWFVLESDAASREIYPFDFRLEIGYCLEGQGLQVKWRVTNTGSGQMYFSIGAHPAFFCSMTPENGPDTDRIHVGEQLSGQFTCYHISENGLALTADTECYPCDLPVTADLFARDAVIADGAQAKRLALADAAGTEYVVMNFEAPLFGLWAPCGDAPFVCLEPWYGRCDAADFTGSLEERVHGNTLKAGEMFNAAYTIALPLE